MRTDDCRRGDFVCWCKGNLFRFGYILGYEGGGYWKIAVRKLIGGIVLSDEWEVDIAHVRSFTSPSDVIGQLINQEHVFPTVDGQEIITRQVKTDLQRMGVPFHDGQVWERGLLHLLLKAKVHDLRSFKTTSAGSSHG